MTLVRIAAGLAWSRSPEHRWRRVAIVAAALLVSVLTNLAVAVVLMADRQEARDDARSVEIAARPARSDVYVERDLDFWQGRRISVAWIEPATPAGDPALPVGARSFPAPGASVVSPELDRLAAQHPGLAARYPHRTVLADVGIRSGGELLAYVRPAAGRTIGGETTAYHRVGDAVVGSGGVVRVARFGRSQHGAPLFLGDVIPLPQIVAGVLGAVVVPALVLLVVGLSAGSRVREHRFRVLAALGAPQRTLAALSVLESLLLAGPALVAGTILWAVVAPHLEVVPGVDYRIVAGDLAVPVPWLLVQLALALLACAVAAAVTARRAHRPGRPETSTDHQPSPYAAVPLMLAVAAFAGAALAGGARGGNLYLVGLVLAVAGTPLVLPGILRSVGELVARSHAGLTALAGRSMSWNPAREMRPFLGLSALLVVVLSVAGIYSIGARSATEGASTGAGSVTGVAAVGVSWRQHEAGDLPALTRRLAGALVAPYQDPEAEEHDHAHAGSVELAATCDRVAGVLAQVSCVPHRPFALDGRTTRQLAGLLSGATGEDVASVRLVPLGRIREQGDVAVLARASLLSLDGRTRQAARATLPAPYVTSEVFHTSPPPQAINGWITAGAAAAFLALAASCLIALVDRLLGSGHSRRHLVNLGVTTAQLRRLEAVTFAVPYVVASVVGLSIGLVICLRMVDEQFAAPWSFVSATGGLVVVAGVVGTVAVATLGARQAVAGRD